jgi:DNA-binding transcriptional regulator YdaS (Cro superfamily)
VTYADLIKFFGTQKAAAEALGLKQPSLSEWRESGIPEPRQAQYELVTKGKLRATRPIAKSA